MKEAIYRLVLRARIRLWPFLVVVLSLHFYRAAGACFVTIGNGEYVRDILNSRCKSVVAVFVVYLWFAAPRPNVTKEMRHIIHIISCPY